MRGEGIQAGDEELANSSCCVEAGCEAHENGSIKWVLKPQLLAKAGDEFGGVGLPFLPSGGGGVSHSAALRIASISRGLSLHSSPCRMC